jgi:hypothetical protein
VIEDVIAQRTWPKLAKLGFRDEILPFVVKKTLVVEVHRKS